MNKMNENLRIVFCFYRREDPAEPVERVLLELLELEVDLEPVLVEPDLDPVLEGAAETVLREDDLDVVSAPLLTVDLLPSEDTVLVRVLELPVLLIRLLTVVCGAEVRAVEVEDLLEDAEDLLDGAVVVAVLLPV